MNFGNNRPAEGMDIRVIDRSESATDGRTVMQVDVNELFGRYSYKIVDSAGKIDPKLGILYGGNGTGKTTILRLLHHILSCSPSRGHKTYVGRIPFRSIVITFSDGLEICTERTTAQRGTFRMHLSGPDVCPRSTKFEVEAGAVRVSSPLDAQQDDFLKYLSDNLGLHSYLLSDDRQLESDVFKEDVFKEADESITDRKYQTLVERAYRLRLGEVEEVEYPVSKQLESALYRAREWARSQALSGADIGSLNANSIYSQVVGELASEVAPESPERGDGAADASQMVRELEELTVRSRDQSRFGLASSFEDAALVHSLKQADRDRRRIIVRLLRPYVDGIRARLDAQEDLYRALHVFTEILNDFLFDKHVTFDTRRGIRVIGHGGMYLSPERLSSGEKQLMMVLCNLLYARQHSSLFLIDEPELSLNVRWQRKLVPAMLTCAEGSNIQFILATHSIELLSHYSDRVLKLSPKGGDLD